MNVDEDSMGRIFLKSFTCLLFISSWIVAGQSMSSDVLDCSPSLHELIQNTDLSVDSKKDVVTKCLEQFPDTINLWTWGQSTVTKKEYLNQYKEVWIPTRTDHRFKLLSPLELAMHIGPKLVPFLLNKGAVANVPNPHDSYYPIHRAVKLGRVDLVKVLAKHSTGINMNVVTDREKGKKTPLHCASLLTDVKLRSEIIDILCKERGEYSVFQINPNLGDSKGDTPLHYLWFVPEPEQLAIQLLTSCGAGVNLTNNLGETPIHRLGMGQELQLANKLIVDYGFDPFLPNLQGRNFYDLANINYNYLLQFPEFITYYVFDVLLGIDNTNKSSELMKMRNEFSSTMHANHSKFMNSNEYLEYLKEFELLSKVDVDEANQKIIPFLKKILGKDHSNSTRKLEALLEAELD